MADRGAALLPYYDINVETGEWTHRHHVKSFRRRWLQDISYKTGHMVGIIYFFSVGVVCVCVRGCVLLAVFSRPLPAGSVAGVERMTPIGGFASV